MMNKSLLHIETDSLDDGNRLVALEGRFTMEDAAALGKALEGLHGYRPGTIFIDCQKLEQVSSSAIGVLIANRQLALSYGGRIVLLSPNRTIFHVLQLTGVVAILPVYSSLEEARADSSSPEDSGRTE